MRKMVTLMMALVLTLSLVGCGGRNGGSGGGVGLMVGTTAGGALGAAIVASVKNASPALGTLLPVGLGLFGGYVGYKVETAIYASDEEAAIAEMQAQEAQKKQAEAQAQQQQELAQAQQMTKLSVPVHVVIGQGPEAYQVKNASELAWVYVSKVPTGSLFRVVTDQKNKNRVMKDMAANNYVPEGGAMVEGKHVILSYRKPGGQMQPQQLTLDQIFGKKAPAKK